MKTHGTTLLLIIPLLLAACAYNRPQAVTAQMATTKAVLNQAESSGAAENALAELQLAKDKYAKAQLAYDKKTEDDDAYAMRLAQQAELDARYAAARAQAQRQQAAAREVQDGLRTLREEVRRDSVTAAPATSSN